MPRLNRPLRRTSDADPDDVLGVKFAFHDLGYYDPPTGEFHPWPDAPLFEAIESFQVDNDLDADGEMLPGGPTEIALNDVPARGFAFTADTKPDFYRQRLANGVRELGATPPIANETAHLETESVTERKGRPPGRPVNLSRCLDSCEMGEQAWEKFCRAIRNPLVRAGCWATARASTTKCRNWCHEQFGKE